MTTEQEIMDGFGVYYDVEPNTGCWLWIRAHSSNGYGNTRFQGKTWRAHRLLYTLFCGQIPDGMFVCHSCDQPACVNPNHMWLGDAKDNAHDCLRKGRWRKCHGEMTYNHKLTEDDIIGIHQSNETNRALGERYSVSETLISKIKHGRAWAHVGASSGN